MVIASVKKRRKEADTINSEVTSYAFHRLGVLLYEIAQTDDGNRNITAGKQK